MSSVTSIAPVVGVGGPELDLKRSELQQILSEALADIRPGSSVLAIIADKTRDDNTDVLFPLAARILEGKRIKKYDALVAQGTHSPMSEREKQVKVGGTAVPGLGKIFDHDWANPQKLVSIGQLQADRVRKLTGGLIDKAITLNVNRLLAPGEYDTVLVFGTTMPHEVAGFSGGAKYFFPGVAGPELTHATHWLGALASIEKVIGRIETPTRHLFEAAADFIPAQVILLGSVVSRDAGRLRTHALFCGDFREAVRKAAEVSRHVHIKYTGRKYRRVVALLDEHLEDMWVGGKASYRLGPVIEEGGELIIYAPHMKSVSDVHGKLIRKYGYMPLESVRDLVATSAELQQNLCVAAHLAHVSFASRRNHEGKVVPRYSITLSSQIPESVCREINFEYLDPATFDRRKYVGQADTFVVENAGRDLYLVEPQAES